MAPLDTTFGIELEALLLQNTYPHLKRGNMTNGVDIIHEALERPLTAVCATCGVVHNFNLLLNPTEYFASTAYRSDPMYSRWTVETDCSLRWDLYKTPELNEHAPHMKVHAIEIKSRVLSASVALPTRASCTNPNHVHSITAEQEISAVHQRLNEFNTPGMHRPFRLVVNETCGLHVHVGNGRRGFPTTTVKNLFKTHVACEEMIDRLHTCTRICGSILAMGFRADTFMGMHYTVPKDGASFNKPLSWVFCNSAFDHQPRVQEFLREQKSGVGKRVVYPDNAFNTRPGLQAPSLQYNREAWLSIIQQARSLTDLQDLNDSYGHRSTLNLENLNEYCIEHPGEKMTIEFRQAAGTLEAEETIAWVNVVVSMVRFAHDTDPADIDRLIAEEWSDPTWDSISFLKTLGCNERVIDHYRRVLGFKGVYANDVGAKDHEAIEALGPKSFFRVPLALLAKHRQDDLDPTKVSQRIWDKLVASGYGQFRRSHLDRIDNLTEEQKTKLTIGWVAPPSQQSMSVARAAPLAVSLADMMEIVDDNDAAHSQGQAPRASSPPAALPHPFFVLQPPTPCASPLQPPPQARLRRQLSPLNIGRRRPVPLQLAAQPAPRTVNPFVAAASVPSVNPPAPLSVAPPAPSSVVRPPRPLVRQPSLRREVRRLPSRDSEMTDASPPVPAMVRQPSLRRENRRIPSRESDMTDANQPAHPMVRQPSLRRENCRIPPRDSDKN